MDRRRLHDVGAATPTAGCIELAEATSDSVAERSNVVTVGAGQVNYVRNAVKATVDAYDRRRQALRLGHQRPDAQGVEQGVPRLGAAAVGDLRASSWRTSATRRTCSRCSASCSASTTWPTRATSTPARTSGACPRDPTQPAQDQPVVFQSIAMPGEDEAAFSLTTPFVPASNNEAGREILRGLLAVDADAGTEAGKPAEGYGSLRLLEFGSATRPARGRCRTRSRTPRCARRTPPSSSRWRSTSPTTRSRASS